MSNDYTYGLGHLNYNTLKHRNLPFEREPFNDQDSCTKWRGMGFSQTYFTGEMYDMRHLRPEWFDFEYIKETFPLWEHLSWSFYKMTPGVILPRHADLYVRFKQMYPDANGRIGRAVVMLEDWKQGHYLDLADQAIINWKAGNYFWWVDDVPHTAANIGTEDRYTLQLTGFIPDDYIK